MNLVCARRLRGFVFAALAAAAAAMAAGEASARTLDTIRSRGRLVICANPDALPFSRQKGDRHGFQIELGEALAKELGVALEVGWVVVPSQMARVDCDLMLDAIVDRDAAADMNLRLSKPYRSGGVAIALRPGVTGIADFSDLKRGQRVGAIVGSLASVTLGRRGLATIPFTFEDDMVEALGNGELDAALVSPASAEYYNSLHPDVPLTVVRAYERAPELSWEIAAGMRHADDALVAAVNQALDRLLSEGAVTRIYARYGIAPSPPR